MIKGGVKPPMIGVVDVLGYEADGFGGGVAH